MPNTLQHLPHAEAAAHWLAARVPGRLPRITPTTPVLPIPV